MYSSYLIHLFLSRSLFLQKNSEIKEKPFTTIIRTSVDSLTVAELRGKDNGMEIGRIMAADCKWQRFPAQLWHQLTSDNTKDNRFKRCQRNY